MDVEFAKPSWSTADIATFIKALDGNTAIKSVVVDDQVLADAIDAAVGRPVAQIEGATTGSIFVKFIPPPLPDKILPDQEAELRSVSGKMDEVATATTTLANVPVPFMNSEGDGTLNSLVSCSPTPSFGDFLKLGQTIKSYFDAVDALKQLPTYSGLIKAIEAYAIPLFGNSAQGTTTAGPVTIGGGFFPDTQELRFDVAFNESKTKVFNLDLGSLTNGSGLTTGSPLAMTLTTTIEIKFSFGLKLADNLSDPDNYPLTDGDVFFRLDTFLVTAKIDATGLTFGFNLGFLSLGVADGSASLNLGVGINLTNGTEKTLTLSDLKKGKDAYKLSIETPVATLAMNLPISAQFGGGTPLVAADATIGIQDNNLFSGAAPDISFNGSVTLSDFKVGSLLEVAAPTLTFKDNGKTLGLSAQAASLTVGSLISASVLDGPDADLTAISGDYTLQTGVFNLTADQVNLTVTNLLKAQTTGTTGFTIHYDPNGAADQQLLYIPQMAVSITPFGGVSAQATDLSVRKNGFSLGDASVAIPDFSVPGPYPNSFFTARLSQKRSSRS